MRTLDLFSGAAGGWTLGLHRAGIETVAACEADPWRRAVYGARWPGVKVYDDVRTLTGERVLADVGPIDLVAGSPPCQDASTANAKGRGIDGERTGLFRDAVRLVRELRPRWVCFENVPGIRTRGADWIIAALEAEGYTVWPVVVGAVHAGAPHRRKRVWFVAHANGQGEHRVRLNGEVAGVAGGKDAAGAARIGQRPRSDFAFAESACGTVADAAGGSRPPFAPWPVADGGAGAAGRGPVVGGACGVSRHSHGEGLEIRQGIGSDARAELLPAIRAIGEAWPDWNGGLAGIGDLDAGLPRGVARAALAAFGDAVIPQIAEAIGRLILTIDARRAA